MEGTLKEKILEFISVTGVSDEAIARTYLSSCGGDLNKAVMKYLGNSSINSAVPKISMDLPEDLKEKVSEFMSVAGVSDAIAKSYLDKSGNDLDGAIIMYLENTSAATDNLNPAVPQASQSSSHNEHSKSSSVKGKTARSTSLTSNQSTAMDKHMITSTGIARNRSGYMDSRYSLSDAAQEMVTIKKLTETKPKPKQSKVRSTPKDHRKCAPNKCSDGRNKDSKDGLKNDAKMLNDKDKPLCANCGFKLSADGSDDILKKGTRSSNEVTSTPWEAPVHQGLPSTVLKEVVMVDLDGYSSESSDCINISDFDSH